MAKFYLAITSRVYSYWLKSLDVGCCFKYLLFRSLMQNEFADSSEMVLKFYEMKTPTKKNDSVVLLLIVLLFIASV